MDRKKENLTTIVIEDDPQSNLRLCKLLSELDKVEVLGTASNGLEGLEVFRLHRPDLIFLDVQMPVMDGFGLIRELQALGFRPPVIFTTGFEKFAIEALRLSAFDFLMKPIEPNELRASVERFRSSGRKDETEEKIRSLLSLVGGSNKIPFHYKTGVQFVDPLELIYAQADGNYTTLVSGKNQSIIVTMKIGDVHDRLPVGLFERIHRSFIINRKYLERMDHGKNHWDLRKGEYLIRIEPGPGQVRELPPQNQG